MSEESSISAYHQNEFSWIRCAGKGNFLNSPLLKEWCEREIENGATCLVIDLEDCHGMDSTFMGTMAGLAIKLMKVPDGKLQIADPGDRNRQSLQDLGLDVMMQIDPIDTCWRGLVSDIRSKLTVCQPGQEKINQGTHVLDAHRKLCEADARNTQKFGTLLDYLEAEVKAKDSSR